MSKRWYIVHTYSGHEAKAKQSLLERAKTFGREDEFDAALDAFCDGWNAGTEDAARFEMEYLLAIGTRA